jgi:hypothetical protein
MQHALLFHGTARAIEVGERASVLVDAAAGPGEAGQLAHVLQVVDLLDVLVARLGEHPGAGEQHFGQVGAEPLGLVEILVDLGHLAGVEPLEHPERIQDRLDFGLVLAVGDLVDLGERQLEAAVGRDRERLLQLEAAVVGVDLEARCDVLGRTDRITGLQVLGRTRAVHHDQRGVPDLALGRVDVLTGSLEHGGDAQDRRVGVTVAKLRLRDAEAQVELRLLLQHVGLDLEHRLDHLGVVGDGRSVEQLRADLLKLLLGLDLTACDQRGRRSERGCGLLEIDEPGREEGSGHAECGERIFAVGERLLEERTRTGDVARDERSLGVLVDHHRVEPCAGLATLEREQLVGLLREPTLEQQTRETHSGVLVAGVEPQGLAVMGLGLLGLIGSELITVLCDDDREQDRSLGLGCAALDRLAKMLLGVGLISDGEGILSTGEVPTAADSREEGDEGERGERTLRLEVEHRAEGSLSSNGFGAKLLACRPISGLVGRGCPMAAGDLPSLDTGFIEVSGGAAPQPASRRPR